MKLIKDDEYFGRISFSEYLKGLYSITNEESQLSAIVDSLKLFSPWWLLTDI